MYAKFKIIVLLSNSFSFCYDEKVVPATLMSHSIVLNTIYCKMKMRTGAVFITNYYLYNFQPCKSVVQIARLVFDEYC